MPVVSWQHAFTLQHPVPASAIGRVIPHVARAPSRQCAAGTPCIPGDVLAAVVHEGLVPGPGAAVMEVPPDHGSLPFLCILPRWAHFPRADHHSLCCAHVLAHPQIAGAPAIVATLFGRVERNSSCIGVAVACNTAPSAIVPHVGCIVICRSARGSRLQLCTTVTCGSSRRVARVVQAKATVDIVEVDGRAIAASFQVSTLRLPCDSI